MIFGGSQVLMDVEPLVRMIRGDPVLHGVTHSLAGALLIGSASALLGRPIADDALRRAAIGALAISRKVAWVSALAGTLSHVGLDAVMHRDMHPFWPLGDGNPLLGIVSVPALYLLCALAGVIGGGVIALRVSRDS